MRIMVTKNEHKSFFQLAEKRHLTLSELVRTLLHRELESEKVKAA